MYLTAEERSKHRSPVMDDRKKQSIFDAMTPHEEKDESVKDVPGLHSPTGYQPNAFLSMNHWVPDFMKSKNKHTSKIKDRRFSDTSDTSYNTATSDVNNSVDLELHIALSCGNVTNIILGDLDPQDKTPKSKSDTPNTNMNSKFDHFILEYHGRLEYAIGGDIVDSLDDALCVAKAGELSITPAAHHIMQRQSMSLAFEKRGRFFVIKNITEDLAQRKPSNPSPLRTGTALNVRKHGSISSSNVDYLKTLPGLSTKASKVSILPLVPRVRNTYHMELPMERNSYYFKYINRSAFYRLQHSVDGNLPAQFREVTIMFVSLGKTDVQTKQGLAQIQQAVCLAIQGLVKYEGMLQQFAIDDKGNVACHDFLVVMVY